MFYQPRHATLQAGQHPARWLTVVLALPALLAAIWVVLDQLAARVDDWDRAWAVLAPEPPTGPIAALRPLAAHREAA